MTNRTNAEKKVAGPLRFYAFRIIPKRLPFWTFSVLFAHTAFPKTVYVATSGADSDPGTQTQPYATIAKAAAVMVGGDTTLIRAGTYNLTAQISPASGSAGKPISYKAYPGESVIINGGSGYCFGLQAKSLAITSLNIGQGADIAGRIVNINRWGASGLTTADYSFDYNCLQIPGADKSIWFVDGNSQYYYTISTWNTAKGFEAHSFSSDPLFVNAATADFHLQTGSTCKAKGKTGEDLGAYPRGNDGTIIGIIGKTTTSSIGQTQPNLIISVKPLKTVGANCTFDILGRRITACPLIPPAGIMIGKDGKRSLGIR